MIIGILHRTIFWELARVFVLSLIGITGIILMAAIVVEASQRGLGPAQVLAAIPLIVPSMLPFIIPPTTLFASCVVFGRLGHDNEITAIKSAGICVLHVVWPGVFLGLVMAAITLGLYYHLIPYTHHLLRTAVVNDIEDYLYAMLKKDHEIKGRPEQRLNTAGERYEVYVGQVQGRQLKTAIFKRCDAKGNYDVIARSSEAELHVDLKRHELIILMRHGHILDESGKDRVFFDEEAWPVFLPAVDENRKPSPRDMTWQQLLEARREVLGQMDEVGAQLAITFSQKTLIQPPADLGEHQKNLQNILRAHKATLNGIDTELQMRPALSAGCLFFVVIGCPIGIWFGRSDYLSAFIICFLPIVFVYYPLQLCSTNLAKDGKLNPMLALWIANAVIGLWALLLFRKLLKN
ncbi:MAG TPA: LptF/LptG family permease [Gemmataceae bacterium]|nr:LptF/LptG family permease [Gemmataceae bacterium]